MAPGHPRDRRVSAPGARGERWDSANSWPVEGSLQARGGTERASRAVSGAAELSAAASAGPAGPSDRRGRRGAQEVLSIFSSLVHLILLPFHVLTYHRKMCFSAIWGSKLQTCQPPL